MLEEIGVEKLKHEAVMVSEVALVDHSDNVMLVIGIFLHDILEILSFLVSKFMVHLSISGNFYCKCGLFIGLVISALHHLRKRSLSEGLHDLISIGNVLTSLHPVVPFEIIKHGITLIFAIAGIILGSNFLLIKSLNPFVIESLHHFHFIRLSCWY